MRLLLLGIAAVLLGAALGLGATWFELGPPGVGRDDFGYAAADTSALLRATGPQPRLIVDHEHFDFGTMERDATQRHSYRFTNTGDAPLTLIQRDTTCKCTISQLENNQLPPGASTDVTLEWTAIANAGPFRQSATIETNDPARRFVTLTVEGRIVFSFEVFPRELVFSSVSSDVPAGGAIRVYGFRSTDLAVLSHAWDDASIAEYFEVATRPMTDEELRDAGLPDRPTSGVVASVTVKPGLPLGPFHQRIRLRLSLPEEPEVEVPISGQVVSDVSVAGRGWNSERGMLDLGVVRRAEGGRAQLLLLAKGPHRQQLKPTVRSCEPRELQVTFGSPEGGTEGAIVRVPMKIEIPPGTRAMNHLGSLQGRYGRIEVDTGHPAGVLNVYVRFAVE